MVLIMISWLQLKKKKKIKKRENKENKDTTKQYGNALACTNRFSAVSS